MSASEPRGFEAWWAGQFSTPGNQLREAAEYYARNAWHAALTQAAQVVSEPSAEEIRLHCGEMSAETMRCVKAVLEWRANAIRGLGGRGG